MAEQKKFYNELIPYLNELGLIHWFDEYRAYLAVCLKKDQRKSAIWISHEEMYVSNKHGIEKKIKVVKFTQKGKEPADHYSWWSPSPLNTPGTYGHFMHITWTSMKDIAYLTNLGLRNTNNSQNV